MAISSTGRRMLLNIIPPRHWLLALLVTFACASASPLHAESPAAATTAKSLFDGRTLQGWKKTEFGGEGEVEIRDGQIRMAAGNPMTGITWTADVPKLDYEITLDAMRVDGSDFFCGLTFPVGDAPCSFIVGGWGGGVIGLSSLDGSDASENETTKYQEFENKRWYRVRLQVTKDKIEAWLDDKQMVDVETKNRRISIRPEVELSRPLGISCFATTAALRNIKLRPLTAATK